MAVEFDHGAVMGMFGKKRQAALIKTAHKGVSIAALNIGKKDGKEHIDIGTSKNAKTFNDEKNQRIGINDDSFTLDAPVEYDIYLEKRYGIMAKVEDDIKPWLKFYMEEAFG